MIAEAAHGLVLVEVGQRQEVLWTEADRVMIRPREQVHAGRSEEGGDEDVLRVVIDRLRRPDLLDAPLRDDDDAIAQAHRLDLIVGDEDGGDAQAPLKILQLIAGDGAQFGIEIRKRFVQQQHRRLGHEGAGDSDALALAPRQLTRFARQQPLNIDHRGGAFDALFDLIARQSTPLCAQWEGDVVVNRHVGIEGVTLKDHRDAAHPRRQHRDILPADPDRPAAGQLQAGDHAHQRRFATAGWAEDD